MVIVVTFTAFSVPSLLILENKEKYAGIRSRLYDVAKRVVMVQHPIVAIS